MIDSCSISFCCLEITNYISYQVYCGRYLHIFNYNVCTKSISVACVISGVTNSTVPVVSFSDLLEYHFDVVNSYNILHLYSDYRYSDLHDFSYCKTYSYKQEYKKMSSPDAQSKRIKDVKNVKITLNICMCVICLVLIPTNIYNIISLTEYNELFNYQAMYVMETFVRLIYQVDASLNFVIYVTLSPKFAKVYRILFLCDFPF